MTDRNDHKFQEAVEREVAKENKRLDTQGERIYRVTATTKEGALNFSAGIHVAENEKAAKAKGRAFFRVSGRDPEHYIFMAEVTTEDELKEGKV